MDTSTRFFTFFKRLTGHDEGSTPGRSRRTAEPGSLAEAARPGNRVYPGTPLSEVSEIFRTGTDHMIPVVAPTGILLGIVRESDLARLLSEQPPTDRTAVLKRSVDSLVSAPATTLSSVLSLSDALHRLQESCQETLPVVTPTGIFLGMVSGGDFLRELVRPLRPPMLGGMATPLGVYLTSGNVIGGVGIPALILTGFLFFLLHLAAYFLANPLTAPITMLPIPLRPLADTLIRTVVQVGVLLAIVRFSPMAGYHAAEHQAVHAVERGEPLTVEVVRSMPRVHPRCGTNLVAGALVVSLIGLLLQPILGSLGYVLGGVTALAVWRDVGSWLQKNITTRPASVRELESGIRAAKEVLTRYDAAPGPVSVPVRLRNMGFLPLLGGFLFAYAGAYLLSGWLPALREPLRTYLSLW